MGAHIPREGLRGFEFERHISTNPAHFSELVAEELSPRPTLPTFFVRFTKLLRHPKHPKSDQDPEKAP